MTELEEEEAGCYTTKKGAHMYHHFDKVMFMTIRRSCSLFIESCSYFSVRLAMCSFKAMISSYWVLDTDLELPTVETLRVTRKFSVVVLESLYT
jgi:hypothetical protein